MPLAPLGLAWLADEATPPAPPPPYRPAPAALERYPGLYRLLDGDEVTIRQRGTDLTAQLRGQPPFALLPLGEDVFASSGGAVGVTFVRNIDQISGLLLRTDGEFISGPRLSLHAPRLPRIPMTVNARTLAGYVGDYRVDDDLMLRVGIAADGLTLQYTGAAPVRLQAYAADRFATDDGVDGLVFHRDDAGRVASVTLQLAGGERTGEPVHWRTQ